MNTPKRGIPATTLVGAVAFLGAVVFATVVTARGSAPMALNQLPDHVAVASALVEGGLHPEALAVAGLDRTAAAAVIASAADQADDRLTQIRVAMDNKAQVGRDLTALRRSGDATDQQLAQARQRVADTQETWDDLVSLICSPAMRLLSPDQARRLASWDSNRGSELPLHLHAASWTADEAAELRQAWRQRSASQSRDDSVDPRVAQIISRAESRADVAAVAATLDVRLAAIQAEWDLALRGDD